MSNSLATVHPELIYICVKYYLHCFFDLSIIDKKNKNFGVLKINV